jgi:uncharacterized protein YmfQ (DUF2313 family)
MSNTCAKLFNTYTIEQHTDSLVAYLPGGELFDAKNEESSTLRRLFAGLAVQIKDVEDNINEVTFQHDINCTTDLIREWESAVGIPDDCFSGTGSLELRRRDVLIKLASLGVSTAKGFIDLAALFGFQALIPSGGSYGIFPLAFPIAFFQYPQDARFTLYVILDSTNVPEVFPFETTKFPIPFFNNVSNIIECLFRKLAPANVNVIFNYVKFS